MAPARSQHAASRPVQPFVAGFLALARDDRAGMFLLKKDSIVQSMHELASCTFEHISSVPLSAHAVDATVARRKPPRTPASAGGERCCAAT